MGKGGSIFPRVVRSGRSLTQSLAVGEHFVRSPVWLNITAAEGLRGTCESFTVTAQYRALAVCQALWTVQGTQLGEKHQALYAWLGSLPSRWRDVTKARQVD